MYYIKILTSACVHPRSVRSVASCSLHSSTHAVTHNNTIIIIKVGLVYTYMMIATSISLVVESARRKIIYVECYIAKLVLPLTVS